MKPEIIRNRWAEVRIYKGRNNKVYTLYTVAWREGKYRQRRAFSKYEEAKEFAEAQLKALSDPYAEVAPILTRDIAYMVKCQRELGDVPLGEVIAFYKEAKRKEAEAAPQKGVTVQEAHRKYMAVLESRYHGEDGRKDFDRHVETTRQRLTPLVDAFHIPMDSVTPEALVAVIAKKKEWSPRTKNNFRAAVSAFYLWANKTRPRMASTNPASHIPKYKEVPQDPEIFTPDEMKELLKAAPVEWRPYFVLGGFAGIRSCELKRLKWSDILWDQQMIILSSSITKKYARRAVPLPPNAMAWLAPYRNWTGPIVPVKRPNRNTAKVAETAKVQWKQNGLRHSAITYMMAKLGNAALVAEHSGNSESEVQRSYKAAVPPSESEKWFAILPA